MALSVPKPMLALLAHKLPVGPQWSYDGYKCLAIKEL